MIILFLVHITSNSSLTGNDDLSLPKGKSRSSPLLSFLFCFFFFSPYLVYTASTTCSPFPLSFFNTKQPRSKKSSPKSSRPAPVSPSRATPATC